MPCVGCVSPAADPRPFLRASGRLRRAGCVHADPAPQQSEHRDRARPPLAASTRRIPLVSLASVGFLCGFLRFHDGEVNSASGVLAHVAGAGGGPGRPSSGSDALGFARSSAEWQPFMWVRTTWVLPIPRCLQKHVRQTTQACALLSQFLSSQGSQMINQPKSF